MAYLQDWKQRWWLLSGFGSWAKDQDKNYGCGLDLLWMMIWIGNWICENDQYCGFAFFMVMWIWTWVYCRADVEIACLRWNYGQKEHSYDDHHSHSHPPPPPLRHQHHVNMSSWSLNHHTASYAINQCHHQRDMLSALWSRILVGKLATPLPKRNKTGCCCSTAKIFGTTPQRCLVQHFDNICYTTAKGLLQIYVEIDICHSCFTTVLYYVVKCSAAVQHIYHYFIFSYITTMPKILLQQSWISTGALVVFLVRYRYTSGNTATFWDFQSAHATGPQLNSCSKSLQHDQCNSRNAQTNKRSNQTNNAV